MVHAMSYTTVSLVIDSWEALRRYKSYEQVAGTLLFQRFFEMAPETKILFGFPIDMDPRSNELLESKRFQIHATYFIRMLDSAFNLLGPDIELLTDVMNELGTKHVRYGVTPDVFPIMGEALVDILEEILGKTVMNDKAKAAWSEVYDALTQDMISARSS